MYTVFDINSNANDHVDNVFIDNDSAAAALRLQRIIIPNDY